MPGKLRDPALTLLRNSYKAPDPCFLPARPLRLGAVFHECLTGRPPFVGDLLRVILAQIPAPSPRPRAYCGRNSERIEPFA